MGGIRTKSEKSDHDHCAFCWTKFVPRPRETHVYVEEGERTLSEGYTTTSEYEHGAGYEWICADCFTDFVDAFGWKVVT